MVHGLLITFEALNIFSETYVRFRHFKHETHVQGTNELFSDK